MPIELKIRRWDDNTQKMIMTSKSEYQITSSQKKSLRVGHATSGGLGDALVKNKMKSHRSFESSAKISSGSEEEYKKDSQSSQDVNELADIEQKMKKRVGKANNETIEEMPSETQSEHSSNNIGQIANEPSNRSKSVPSTAKKSVTKLKTSKNYPEKSDQLQGRTYKVAPGRAPENAESSESQSNISRSRSRRGARNRKIKDDESSNKSFGNKSASSMTKTISDNDSMGGGKAISTRRTRGHLKQRNQVSTIIEENEADVSMKDEVASDNHTTRSRDRGAKQGKFILQRRNDESESEEDVAEDDGMS